MKKQQKSCQEPLIACCKGLSVPSEFQVSKGYLPLGSRLVYHKQTPESAGSHPTWSLDSEGPPHEKGRVQTSEACKPGFRFFKKTKKRERLIFNVFVCLFALQMFVAAACDL